MDMAVGIIRGAAFTAIASSLVDDPINPIIGLFTGGIDVTGLTVPLTDRPDGAAFAYGTFLMAVVNFLIVAWAVFLLVKGVNRGKRMAEQEVEKPKAAPAGPSEKERLTEIRDALRAGQGRAAG